MNTKVLHIHVGLHCAYIYINAHAQTYIHTNIHTHMLPDGPCKSDAHDHPAFDGEIEKKTGYTVGF